MRFVLFSIVTFLLLPAHTGSGQSRRDVAEGGDTVLLKGFLVEGGRVNVIEGQVGLVSGSKSIVPLKPTQTFSNGDTIYSGPTGRAEIILSPGYYLRLDRNSLVSLLDLSSDNLKLKLWRGSLILEVATNEMPTISDYEEPRKQLSYEPVSILTPDAEYIVVKGGGYRFNVGSMNNSDLSVVKGLAFVSGSRIRHGTMASIEKGKVVISAIKSQDEFDRWNLVRAGLLVKANHSLSKEHWYKQIQNNRAYVSVTDPKDPSRAKQRLTVSAETGVVVLAENAFVSPAAEINWRKLNAGETLTNGDRVRTAVESRAEIHPYATCFLFLGSNTEIVFREDEGRVAIELIRGSAIAIIESNSVSLEPAVLTIVENKFEHKISQRGNYRITANDGSSDLLVYNGPTRVPAREVPPSRKQLPSDIAEIGVEFDKLTGDSFDVWSYRRSRLPMIRAFQHYLGPFGGMWFFQEATGQYIFVPARWEYGSPYGGKYSVRFAEDTSRRRLKPNPSSDPFPPPFRPIRPNKPGSYP